MDTAFLILVTALGAVLLVSGAAKVRAADSPEELEALGVPRFLRNRAVIAAHPWAEIALGIGVLATSGWLLVAIAAASTALLAVYAILITRAVLTGSAETCNCFGELFDARLTWRSVARNLTLMAISLAVLAGTLGGQSVPRVVGEDPNALLAVLAAAVVAGLLWTIAAKPAAASPAEQTPADADGEPPDYVRLPIPYGWLETESGSRSTLRDLARQKARVLVFLSTGCHACTDTAESLRDWMDEFDVVDIRPVFSASPKSVHHSYPWLAGRALYESEMETSRVLGMRQVPSAVILGIDGLLAGGPVAGHGNITRMITEMRAELASVAG